MQWAGVTLRRLFGAAVRESVISYAFVRSNLLIGVPPAVLMSLSAMVLETGASRRWAFVNVVLFAALAIYVFDVSNQLAGIEEDRLNKPGRPLPAGLLTPRQARRRLVAAALPLLLVAAIGQVIAAAVCWIALAWLNNQARLARNGAAKSALVGFQAFVQLAAAWRITAPLPPRALAWIILTSGLLAFLMPLQDLRDVPGDMAVGRRTLPVALGPHRTRVYLRLAFLACPLVVYFGGHPLTIHPSRLLGFALAQALLSVIVCVRLRYTASSRTDHSTYTLLVYWYMAMAIAPALLL